MAIGSSDGRDILRHSTAHVLAQAVQDLFPDAKLGIGPPVENGFYYDFDVETPFVPEDLEKIETRMRKIIKDNQRFSRRVGLRRRGARGALRRAVQAGADRPQGLDGRGGRRGSRGRGRRGRRRRADDLRQPQPQGRGGLEGPVPWPAPADHEADPGVQADAHRGGVLARQREEPAAAADLRHRLGDQGGARGAPAPPRGGRAARPPQARVASSTCSASPTRSAPGLAVFHPKGGVLRKEMEDYSRRRHERGGLRVRQHAPHHQGAAVRGLRAPGLVRRRHVPAHAARRRRRQGAAWTTTSSR